MSPRVLNLRATRRQPEDVRSPTGLGRAIMMRPHGHSINRTQRHGSVVGGVLRSPDPHATDGLQQERCFRRNLRKIGDPERREFRAAVQLSGLSLHRMSTQDPDFPFGGLREDHATFGRFPTNYRMVAETCDHSRVKILARDELRDKIEPTRPTRR